MVKRKCRHLAPLDVDKDDMKEAVSVLDDLTDQWDEMNRHSKKISHVLRAVSRSNLLGKEVNDNINSIVKESEDKASDFDQRLINIKKKRNKRKLKIDVTISKDLKIGTKFQETVEQKMKKIETDANELAFQLMSKQGLGKDWTFNQGLSQMEMAQVMKNIVRLEQTIIRYRNYYGHNPLLWTPSERTNVSKIYMLLSKEYGILHYEEGRDRNKMIADNLVNNPLNKLRRFNRPSAPRGPNNKISVNTFKKFVDGD
tara:strand:+ start:81 stop:848 length:768 start_codon:yes stop_codon:yes gene_type:complete